jgi:Fic family protein
MWQPDRPFEALAPPPVQKLETFGVLKATTEARAALASLDQALKTIPNPNVLIGTIPLLEAQASSEVENIVTTTDELFRYASEVDGSASPEAKETLRYRSALYSGARIVKTRPITIATAVEVCSQVRGVEVRVREHPGTYIGNPTTGAVIYTPPDGKVMIEQKLSQWEDFLHADSGLDPLVVMAAAHYQFEAIHPFSDGNGRTGRILNVLLLLEAGLLEQPVLYLSRFIIQNKDEYYRRLLAVTSDGEWEPWILFMLQAVEKTSKQTLNMIGEIQKVQGEFRETMRVETTAGANADLLDLLFERPYSRIGIVMDRCSVSRPTATKWLRGLVEAGLLVEMSSGREKLFVNTKMLDALGALGSPTHR